MTNPKPLTQKDTPDQLYPDDPFGAVKESVQDPTPQPRVVNQFHTRSDKDSTQTAQHHTLGTGHNQSSPGDHKHDGVTSKKLLDAFTINGSRSDTTTAGALYQVLQALTALGIVNSSLP